MISGTTTLSMTMTVTAMTMATMTEHGDDVDDNVDDHDGDGDDDVDDDDDDDKDDDGDDGDDRDDDRDDGAGPRHARRRPPQPWPWTRSLCPGLPSSSPGTSLAAAPRRRPWWPSRSTAAASSWTRPAAPCWSTSRCRRRAVGRSRAALRMDRAVPSGQERVGEPCTPPRICRSLPDTTKFGPRLTPGKFGHLRPTHWPNVVRDLYLSCVARLRPKGSIELDQVGDEVCRVWDNVGKSRRHPGSRKQCLLWNAHWAT